MHLLLYFMVLGELVAEWAIAVAIWWAVIAGPGVYYDSGITAIGQRLALDTSEATLTGL